LLVVLAIAAACAGLLLLGYEQYQVAAIAIVVLAVYFYVLYKRYNVEVIPERDILLFEDPDDLRILCSIYGLDLSGGSALLRQRLIDFSRANKEQSFVWVVPRAVSRVGAMLEAAPQVEHAASQRGATELVKQLLSEGARTEKLPSALVGGKTRSQTRRLAIRACPVCDSPVQKTGHECVECGADLEFYLTLSESRVGRRLISEKAETRRRKLRYEVTAIRAR